MPFARPTIVYLAINLEKIPIVFSWNKKRLVNSCIYEKGNYTSQLRQQRHGGLHLPLNFNGNVGKKR